MDKHDVEARRGIAELALKGFFDIACRWKLNRQEAMTLLGLTATSTYANWKNGNTNTLPRDTLERISYLLEIDRTLKSTLNTEEKNSEIETINVLNTPLPSLKNQSPLDKMLMGNVADIYLVQQALQS